MAYLVRQQKTVYVDAAGKRVPKGTPGAKKVRTRLAKWYGVGVPGLPPRKRVPLAAAWRMLDDLVRRAERGHAGLPDADAARRPLADLLPAFEADVRLRLASRGGRKHRPPDPAHAGLVVRGSGTCSPGAGSPTPQT